MAFDLIADICVCCLVFVVLLFGLLVDGGFPIGVLFAGFDFVCKFMFIAFIGFVVV